MPGRCYHRDRIRRVSVDAAVPTKLIEAIPRATMEMQSHHSTVDGAEVHAGLGQVIQLAGLRGGDGGGDGDGSPAPTGREEAA
jgi:hypothetical protein